MTPQNLSVAHDAYERILADAMVDVATELRLSDPLEFLVMIRGNQEANIADLVNSSSELFFTSGALRYGLAALCDLRWEATPSVRLDMEFRHAGVTVFFRLTIGRAHAGVEIIRVMIDAGDDLDAQSATARMSQALWDAQLR
jgi:hypothetical protein